MKHLHGMALLVICSSLLAPALAVAGFPGRPILLSAEGGTQNAAWVAYENGDVLRCRAATGSCQVMTGLPTFATPISLSAATSNAAAWIGWSDGSLYHCSAIGRCTALALPTDTSAAAGMH